MFVSCSVSMNEWAPLLIEWMKQRLQGLSVTDPSVLKNLNASVQDSVPVFGWETLPKSGRTLPLRPPAPEPSGHSTRATAPEPSELSALFGKEFIVYFGPEKNQRFSSTTQSQASGTIQQCKGLAREQHFSEAPRAPTNNKMHSTQY